jgi:hypothetical protein
MLRGAFHGSAARHHGSSDADLRKPGELRKERSMKLSTVLSTGLIFGVLLTGVNALGADHRPKLSTRMGMSAMVGAGVVGFTEPDIIDMTSPGGSWTCRILFGTRTFIGAEAAYVGSAQEIDALKLDNRAMLVSNGLEGALRLHIATEDWQPYFFLGAAWKKYSVVNADYNTSSVKDSDNIAEVPFGVGFAYRFEGFVLDARLAIRPAFDSDLVRSTDGNELTLTSWDTSLRLGWEF